MSVSVAPISNFETNVRRKGKAGRPALDGERYPSGKLKPADRREGGPAPTEIKRAFAAAIRGAGNPLLGTSLGMLYMRGEITAPQLAAGAAYARLQGRYDRAMMMPCRFTASADYGVARAISSKGPVSDEETVAVKARHAAMVEHLRSKAAGSITVSDGAGGRRQLDGEAARPVHAHEARRTLSLLERVCVDDLACESYEIDRLRNGLEILAPWFGVGSQMG